MRIHFIAIGGSVMHQLAIALHKKGHQVSGSDDKIFDPARSNLNAHGLLPDAEGWFPEKISSAIDAVILGMHAKNDNPELAAAQQLQIPIKSFPEYIHQHAIDKQRVVIGGSHGKTTITSMLLHVLKKKGRDTDILVGAKLKGFKQSVKLTPEAELMIIEGDEYLSSPLEPRPKFHFYKPHIAFISGIAWDHVNVFPSYDNYYDQFDIFCKTIEKGGTLVFNADDPEVVRLSRQQYGLRMIPYRLPVYDKTVGGWTVHYGGEAYPTKIFGRHNMSNLAGAMAVGETLGISKAQFLKAMHDFEGAARRLQTIGNGDNGAVVIKDFAHAPSKVKASVQAVRDHFPDKKLICCFELHTYSSLQANFLPQYASSLNPADEATVFYNAETLALKRAEPLSASTVKTAFGDDRLNVFSDADAFKNHLYGKDFTNCVLLLMSSGNFGGLDLTDITKFATATSNITTNKSVKKPMLQLQRPLVIFDLESTGINLAKDRIVEICIMKIQPDGSEEVKTWLVNPTIPIPKQVSEIHGITDEDVKDAPTFTVIATDVMAFMEGCDIGGYNSNYFDVPLLQEELLRLNMDIYSEERKFVDVFKIFQRMESRTLTAAYKFYCGKDLVNAHSAEADVRATYEVLLGQLKKYEGRLEGNIDALYEFTKEENPPVDSGRRMVMDKGVVKFNFGKYKGQAVEKVLQDNPGYYDWIMKSDFLLDTKQKLRQIKLNMTFRNNSGRLF